jgi:hypothetical protein
MSPELIFWLALTTKMAVTALFVSIAIIIDGMVADTGTAGWDDHWRFHIWRKL